LLLDSLKSAPCPHADSDGLQLPAHEQTSPEGMIEGLDQQVWSERAFRDHIYERSQRTRDTDSLDGLNIRPVATSLFGGRMPMHPALTPRTEVRAGG
jgi:hypothetical protein